MSPNSIASMFDLMNTQVVDGAKAGAAATVATEITTMVVTYGGVKLPEWFESEAGKAILPILVCYGIAFLTVLVPGIPMGDKVRAITMYAARGTATLAVHKFMPKISQLVPMILGVAAMHGVDETSKAAEASK